VVHDEAAGFVLDALDPRQAEEFARHLRLCPDCEQELEPLRLAAAALAFAGELPRPPARLRRVVVRRLRGRVAAPAAPVAALAACATVALALTGHAQTRHVSFQLPPAPAEKVYEIWFVRRGDAVPAGFAHAGRNEIRNVPRGAAVAVTLEPRSGSRRPTGPLLLRTETA
jgi:hypothetical protein